MKIKFLKYSSLFLLVIIMNSCLGLSMDIQLKRNGSGRITLEYQIPKAMENIGKLDGNQAWPIIPVGKKDWERSVSGIDGAKLVSFSSKNKSDDIITKIVLDFNNIETLVKILGNKTTYTNGNLEIVLFDPEETNIDPDLIDLLKQVSKDKKITIKYKEDGKKPSSFEINTADIFDYKDKLVIKLN